MSASPNGSPHSVCDDAMRRTEAVIDDLLDRDPMPHEYRLALVVERDALRSARALADARAKQAEADMGGTTLDLSDADDAQKLRALLALVADALDYAGGPVLIDGVTVTVADARRFRKSINAGVSRRCEARCATTDETFRGRAADAVASSDDEEVAA